MLIALLAVLGVDLIVLVAFVAIVITRKRWVKRRPGAFRGVIRVASGEVDGLRPKWGLATGAGSATSSSGRRRRSCSGTSWWLPTAWTSNALHLPMRSSGWVTTPA
jgi:hypothetical protein